MKLRGVVPSGYEAQTTDIRTLYVRTGDGAGALSVVGTLAPIAVAFPRSREQ